MCFETLNSLVKNTSAKIFQLKYFIGIWGTTVPSKLEKTNLWGNLGDLVPFVQFKKREKHPCTSDAFSKVPYFRRHIC